MAGPVNIWSAGQDALLQQLALRDAEQQREAELARRAQLDAEAAADREEMRRIQREQMESAREEREARIKAGQESAAEKKKTAEEKAIHNQHREDLIYAYQHAPNKEEKAKYQEILQLRFPDIRFEKPAEEPKPQLVTMRGPKGEKLQKWVTPKLGESYESYIEPDTSGPTERPATDAQIAAALQRARREAQDPLALPKGMTVDQFEQELRDQYLADLRVDPKKYPMLPKNRPPASLPGAGMQMQIIGPTKTGQDIDLPKIGRATGAGPVGAPGGAPPPAVPSSAAATPPVAEAPPVTPPAAPVKLEPPTREGALAYLKRKGKPTTDANIAATMQFLATKQGQ